METTFAAEKRTVRVQGELPRGRRAARSGAAGTPLRGYEIHMGRSRCAGARLAPLLRTARRRRRGSRRRRRDAPTAWSCGSYVHGLFDDPGLRAAFLNRLRAARGLPSRPAAPPARRRYRPPRRPRAGSSGRRLLASIVGLDI